MACGAFLFQINKTIKQIQNATVTNSNHFAISWNAQGFTVRSFVLRFMAALIFCYFCIKAKVNLIFFKYILCVWHFDTPFKCLFDKYLVSTIHFLALLVIYIEIFAEENISPISGEIFRKDFKYIMLNIMKIF